MDEYMIFAERLTAEMERQELTYRQLAEKMGIAVTTLFRYAKGQRVPKATEIVKASKALGVTCDYLIGLSDDPHKTSTESVYYPVSVNTDLISRQQAFDALHCRFADGFEEDRWWNSTHVIAALKGLPSAQPEHKTGHWILDRSGAYCCSECMEPCAGYVMMKPRDKYCKMCGSRNEVTE